MDKKWTPTRNEPCPCGSGLKYKKCGAVKAPHPAPVTILAPVSTHSHPKCYLKRLGGCSRDISREHYISKAVLERFAPASSLLEIHGLRGRAESLSISPKKLASKILCSAHNNALAPLDDFASQLFSSLQDVFERSGRGRAVNGPRFHAFNGTDLERWLLKLCIGVLASQHLSAGTHAELSGAACGFLLGSRGLASPAGLYLPQLRPTPTRRAIGIWATFDAQLRECRALTISFYELRLLLSLHSAPPSNAEELVHRPQSLRVVCDDDRAAFLLAWPEQGEARHATLHFE
jgi:hypothetical protein